MGKLIQPLIQIIFRIHLPSSFGRPRLMLSILPVLAMRGYWISITAMISTTFVAIVLGFGWFVSKCDMEVSVQQIYQAYKKCHKVIVAS